MNPAQSPHVPQAGQKPALKDLPWLTVFVTRGLWELVKARIVFSRFEVRDLPFRNREAKKNTDRHSRAKPSDVARISYVLPRLSDRLPWRSDCLIQAIAAQNWLSGLQAVSEIQIGVENPTDGQFGAHAWLLHDGKVVTGGEIDQYDLILADSTNCDDSEGSGVHRAVRASKSAR